MASVRAGSVFLVSCAALTFEVLLTRYFAIASWAEYGYWVISMAMTGFAVSGVLLALFRGTALKWKDALFRALPILLMICAAAGYYFTTTNAFNPLELQNAVLWKGQLANIAKYYTALFPFFFLAGFFLGLSWAAFQDEVAKLYAADLVGAGFGATLVLLLMFVVHPFYLMGAVPVLLLLTAVLNGWKISGPARFVYLAVALCVFAACEVNILAFNKARFFEYKGIYPVLHVEGNRILDEYKSPRGYYLVLDNFTERRDMSLSNNLGLMGSAGTPSAPGIYKDGNRMAALLPEGEIDLSYVPAALSTLPYRLRPDARTLLIGSSGGFRPVETKTAGAGEIVVAESDPVVFALARKALAPRNLEQTRLLLESPHAILARDPLPFDIIDVSEDYLDEGPANKYAVTVQAMERYFERLSPTGIVSIPISIREFSVYAVRLAETARTALTRQRIANPEQHLVVYRSEWTARVLIGKQPFSQSDIAAITAFCSDLSFDTSYFAGIDPASVEVWNDLPPVSFADETEDVSMQGPSDALRDDVMALYGPNREAFLAANFFNLTPPTDDRPFLNYIFRPSRLGQLLDKLELVPHEEVGFLTNIAVLAQAVVMAAVVLLLPLIRWKALRAGHAPIVRGVLYFAGLGLGFLFIEIALIDKFARLLNDNVSSFAVVLCAMLISSGLGSALAGRYSGATGVGVRRALVWIAIFSVGYVVALDSVIEFALSWPAVAHYALIVVAIAPISIALGMMFPLGMSALGAEAALFVPVAWAVNGAFSVIASPLASVLAVLFGYRVVFAVACAAYVVAYFSLPTPKMTVGKGL